MKTLRHWMVVLALASSLAAIAAEEKATEAPNESREEYGPRNPLVAPITFAPHLSLVAVPTPRFGLDVKYMNWFAVSFEYGLIPTINFGQTSVGTTTWAIEAKYFPWKRAMYIGFGFGSQNFSGAQTDAGLGLTVTTRVSTTYINPHVGWHWTWPSGFFYGVQLGVQVPLTISTATTGSPAGMEALPQFTTLANAIDTYAQTFGRIPLPWITGVQIGWYL